MFHIVIGKGSMAEFYSSEFKRIRQLKKISIENIVKALDISRVTLWRWENGKGIPSELQIKMLAKLLNESVTLISDLQEVRKISKGEFSEIVNSWLVLEERGEKDFLREEEKILNLVHKRSDELRKASVIIRALLASMQSMFYVKDYNLKYITANSSFLENLSLPKNYSVLGKIDEDFFPINEAKANSKEDNDVLNNGRPIVKIEKLIPGSKRKKWGIISKLPIFDAEGDIAGVVGTFVDITEKRIVEIRRSVLEGLLNNVENVVCVYNFEKDSITFVNDTAEKILGYSKEEFKKVAFWEKHIDLGNKKRFKDVLIQKEEILNFSFKFTCKNGKAKWLKTISHLHSEVDGKHYCFWVLKDYTDERFFEEQKELLRILLDSSDDVVGVYDITNGRDMYVSESIYKLTGYTAVEIYENPNIWYDKCIHPEDQKLRKKYASEKEWPPKSKLRIVNKNGKVVLCEIIVSRKTVADRLCHIWIARDISDRKDLHSALPDKEIIIERMLQNKIEKNIIAEILDIPIHEVEKYSKE